LRQNSCYLYTERRFRRCKIVLLISTELDSDVLSSRRCLPVSHTCRPIDDAVYLYLRTVNHTLTDGYVDYRGGRLIRNRTIGQRFVGGHFNHQYWKEYCVYFVGYNN